VIAPKGAIHTKGWLQAGLFLYVKEGRQGGLAIMQFIKVLRLGVSGMMTYYFVRALF
jgi:hypothetical protein